MKTLIMLLSLLFTATSFANTAPVERLNTTEGYPYKNVIFKAERVELHYSQLDDKVECKVVVSDKMRVYSSETQQVSQKKFSRSPMAACLTRRTAKQILAKL
ncbi:MULTISPECIES: hypothetical protein [Pseudoalteromonas]|uniref:Uncharacterized protein n=1 Tax=Pseudoalteromonas amylolytica TaxID=1859457 RepID=A0A1S1MQ99_9GAMM|nr:MULTISPECIES: hypothetical protein [Pseudoalteromonas]OHU84241.1 hypothetical protein BFC16_00905 [Pseudoalteromonas sp. JW3]OHU87218.1 hypothetical protein BET10_01030 [Pseudoalteromonas amylolytica]